MVAVRELPRTVRPQVVQPPSLSLLDVSCSARAFPVPHPVLKLRNSRDISIIPGLCVVWGVGKRADAMQLGHENSGGHPRAVCGGLPDNANGGLVRIIAGHWLDAAAAMEGIRVSAR